MGIFILKKKKKPKGHFLHPGMAFFLKYVPVWERQSTRSAGMPYRRIPPHFEHCSWSHGHTQANHLPLCAVLSKIANYMIYNISFIETIISSSLLMLPMF